MIVLAFWVLAYECEGALFFHHVQKSAERSVRFYKILIKLIKITFAFKGTFE